MLRKPLAVFCLLLTSLTFVGCEAEKGGDSVGNAKVTNPLARDESSC